MENASKALIIAGAILLSILIISLGIMIFNQAQEATKNNGMTKAEVSTYNAQYTKYEGIQSGTNVKSLIQEVIANNASDAASGNERKVEFTSTAPAGSSNGTVTVDKCMIKSKDISSTTKYMVEISAYDDSGYVKTINIYKVKQ